LRRSKKFTPISKISRKILVPRRPLPSKSSIPKDNKPSRSTKLLSQRSLKSIMISKTKERRLSRNSDKLKASKRSKIKNMKIHLRIWRKLLKTSQRKFKRNKNNIRELRSSLKMAET